MGNANLMRQAKVLLTGFKPFGGSNYNVSEQVIQNIKLLQIDEVNLSTIILPVDESGTKLVSKEIINEKFDCIIHLGFSDKAKLINLECRAMNTICMDIKDNSGRMISKSKIIDISENEYFSTIPYDDYLLESPATCKLSLDAGKFVCNETYFRTLNCISENDLIDRFGRTLPCVFIHLPSESFVPLSEQINFILWLVHKMTYKKIIDVVAGIIRNEDQKILVAKRDLNQPHPGKWEFPGGKLNINESNEDALKREIFEELNLDIQLISDCASISHLYEEYFVNLNSINAIIKDDSDKIKLNVHEEIMWVREEELSEFDWLEANKKLVKIIQNHS
tara:strand:- start:1383 stop:2387 length:1005 start_codon:yes stop_codon:yes gene_type:complete